MLTGVRRELELLDDAEGMREFEDQNRAQYVLNCLVGERTISSKISRQDIEQVLNRTREGFFAGADQPASLQDSKILNALNAVDRVFPKWFLPRCDVEFFAVELANKIHEYIGHGIINNAGTFRSCNVMPFGEQFRYLDHSEIPTEMNALFCRTRREILSTDELHIERVVKIVAQFLNKFLFIHPYTNGNGRVARILASCLLSRISVAPISLTDTPKNAVIYLDCLRQTHSPGCTDQPPAALTTFLLERVFYALDNFYKTFC